MRMRRTLADVLVGYADHLNDGKDVYDEFMMAFPECREELAGLMDVARRIKQVMSPRRPALAYRSALKSNLLEAAQHKVGPRITIRNPFRKQRIILIGAAIGSAVSVLVGILAAVLLHNKAGQRSQRVPSA